MVLSGPPAVGKTTVARIISSKLPLKYVSGGDMLKEIAKEKGYRVGGEEWWDTDEGQKFLQERAKDFRYDLEVDRRLQQLVTQGGYVITSYAIPWLNPNGVKVWLKASQLVRARRMARRDSITVEKALEVVRLRDRENAELYKRMYGYEFEKDLSVFDLMVNTEQIEAEEVANLIIQYVSSLQK
ncbi:MAG: cytidylate kinase family protein [Conexivisphaerales archaeon]